MTKPEIHSPPETPVTVVKLPRRLAALFYDSLVATALLFIAATPIVIAFEIDQTHRLYWIFVLYIYGVLFLYLGWFWTHGGQTIGMKTWRFRLVTQEGLPVGLTAALRRFALALVFWVPAGYGVSHLLNGVLWIGVSLTAPIICNYAACVLRSDRMALHDVLSRTRFIRVS
ncbi:MAG: RDD family protein [Gammaproteobacteria bacterium]|jgi:uncharacterized RDD family membrane protein YckC|nr:RDD family protein [Gammaproteobacteria bacterium]